MPLPPEHLSYPLRRYGMDHDRYDWSMLPRRAPVRWPNGARVALWVTPVLEFFPLDPGTEAVKAPGGMQTPYPDLRHFSLRDYGNRVGIYRLLEVFDRLGIRASVPVNAAVAERHPSLLREITRRGYEVIGHGIDMATLHFGGLEEGEERRRVQAALGTLRRLSGQPVTGWLSPAKSESANTLDLVAAEGISYVCDWINDDLPYPLRTRSGTIHALPHATELSDFAVIFQAHQSEAEFAAQVRDQFDMLYGESETKGGRIMAVTLHPWISGQPHRIKAVADALGYVVRRAGVWSATGAEILAAFKAQA
ncbi:MAG: polysaccharide deacetylase [Alphaproteobacteria bacterium]|nr:polysaccharide deacetylase [Alphaproteobacteria bacterium]